MRELYRYVVQVPFARSNDEGLYLRRGNCYGMFCSLAVFVAAVSVLPAVNLHWRSAGPAVAGGRVTSVAGSARDPNLYYLGAAGGGVWKSTNGGAAWTPVFDKQSVGAIGAVAIDPADDQTVWVGTGEANPRNDVSYGDGVYKSTDGGKTWTNAGLRGTKYIARILIDPTDPQHVIVGALGDVFAASADRGAYVTFDGGKTWAKTLDGGPISGISDLAMNPRTPNVIYAGVWEFQRRPWTFRSGGERDACIARPTADGRGAAFPGADCPPALPDASAWQWHRALPIACTRSSNRSTAFSGARTTAAKRGRW